MGSNWIIIVQHCAYQLLFVLFFYSDLGQCIGRSAVQQRELNETYFLHHMIWVIVKLVRESYITDILSNRWAFFDSNLVSIYFYYFYLRTIYTNKHTIKAMPTHTILFN